MRLLVLLTAVHAARGALLPRLLDFLGSSHAEGLQVQAPRLDRRGVLRAAAASTAALAGAPAHAGGVPEGMRTSESYTNLQQLSPETTGTLGAGTMSSRSRPATGVVLVEEVQASGPKDAPSVSAELALDGGVAASVAFQAEPGFALIRGMFYDVEVRNKAGSSSFLQVASLPSGKSLADVSDSLFTKAVFSAAGRFGAYGAATDIKVKSAEAAAGRRTLDVSFAALSPSGTEAPRRALITAIQPAGSTDVVMLVGSASKNEWPKEEAKMRAMGKSLEATRMRKSGMQRLAKSDYRFEERGGLLSRESTDSALD